MGGLRDVSGVKTVVIRHVTVIVFFHQRQIVHEHLLRDFQHCQQLVALECTAHDSTVTSIHMGGGKNRSAVGAKNEASSGARNG